ncbi:MAG: CHASE2 domain-containing protein [Candidatus Binataceae bacterium]
MLGLLVLVRIINPRPVEDFRLRSFDIEQQIIPRQYRPMPVRIVAIDEHSLAKYGQWPWPRTLVARLVRQIAAENPRVLGVDIIFSEPDSHSPKNIAKEIPNLPSELANELGRLPDNEAALADAFRGIPTVLGIGVGDQSTPVAPGPSRITIIRQSGADPRPFLADYPHLIRSLPELRAAARGAGSLVDNPDPDGMVRRVPMFIVGEGNLIPALSLEMVRVAAGAGSVGIVADVGGIKSVSVGDIDFPTDRTGRAYPHFSKSLEYRYLSAADLIDRTQPAGDLQGAFVLLGVTGQGWVDLQQTPLGLMAGVEVHAQLLESMLTGNLLRRPHFLEWLEIITMIVGGLLTIFALPYSRPAAASIVFAALVVIIVVTAFAGFYLFNLLIAGTFPAVSSAVVFSVMLAANLRSAEAARNLLTEQLEHEREVEARLDGELNAARSIQMGLLPHKFPGPPQQPAVEVFALIEPARMVGGDLYDFLLLDPHRLAFAIADVSGKGVPAALFMAMTKEVLRDTTQRHADALDRAFAEANAKIGTASNDMFGEGAHMMFVTVFAGVLDLASGVLTYVNAGHESPFVLRQSAELRELSGEGGPPLGAVDDFVYPVERCQLSRGDIVLLYTDGVTDAEDERHTFYGMARLKSLLSSAPVTGARDLIEFVRGDIRRFVSAAEHADDVTLLAIRWIGTDSADSLSAR